MKRMIRKVTGRTIGSFFAILFSFAGVAHADMWKDAAGVEWTYTIDGDEATIVNWVG